MRHLALSLILAASPALAGDLVLKNKQTGAQLRLMDTTCSHAETMAHLKEEWRPKFKNARMLDAKGHIQFYGCWIQHDEDTAVIFLQDGGHIGLPLAAFSDPSV